MSDFLRGMSYVLHGLNNLHHKGLKRFVIMPLLLNLLLFASIMYFFVHFLFHKIETYVAYLPSWLGFLNSIIFVLLLISFLLLFYSLFSVFFNIIAAPFNGFLAEKAQAIFFNHPLPETRWHELIIRTSKRQLKLLAYFLPRFILIVALFFIPFIHPIYPIIWFLFNAWMLALQYQDFAMDNNHIDFMLMRQFMGDNKAFFLGFGSIINVLTLIPLVNILIMPAAAIAGVSVFCQEYLKEQNIANPL